MDDPPVLLIERVQPGRDQCRQRVRDGERGEVALGYVDAAFSDQLALGHQGANGLDRIQRDAVGPRDDRGNGGGWETRREAGQQLAHVVSGERLEIHGDEVALAGTPIRPALDQVRSGERYNVDRVAAREVEQVVDEVEQARVGEVHVLEDERNRTLLGNPFEEGSPRPEQLVRGHPALDAEQGEQRPLDPLTLGLVLHPLGDRFLDLRPSCLLVVEFGQARRARGPSHRAPRT